MQVGDRVRFPNKDIGTVVKMDGDDLVVIISQTPWSFPRWVHCTRQSVKLVRTSKKDQLNDMEEALF